MKLTVTDAQTGATDTLMETIRTNDQPTAVIPLPSPINVCGTVKLSGTSSTDDGSVVSYFWTLDAPSVLNNSASPTPTFEADKRSAYTVTLKVTDNLGLSSAEESRSFTPVRNSIGQGIYDNGLPGTLKCTDCHAAGNYDGTTNTIYTPDPPNLSDIIFDVGRITARVKQPTTNHPGGKTTLVDPELTTQVTALRQFLDSTLANCP